MDSELRFEVIDGRRPLAGRTAIVTGSCGDGIGRSTALLLGALGCNVVLNYGTYNRGSAYAARAKRIVAALRDFGARSIVIEADTASEDDVRGLVDAATAAYDGIDFLIINSGGNWDAKEVESIGSADWKVTLAAEIDSVFLLFKYAIPILRRTKDARVILLGLTGSLTMQDPCGMAFDYCLGRAARSWMTTALGALEYPNGVSVNIVEPGYIYALHFDKAVECVRSELEGRLVVSEKPTCHDVARIISFLCSPAARFVSKTVVDIPTSILPVYRQPEFMSQTGRTQGQSPRRKPRLRRP
jgi:3-oxoacyl-[acyl-carrier protein] reductase